jgi:hypothetical protein
MNESGETSYFDSPLELVAPRVEELLANIPGGQPNLLPEAATHDDLKVWFELWAHSEPQLGEESVELFLDDQPVDRRTWNAPIEASDRYVTLPKTLLRDNDGPHRLRYTATVYNGGTDNSAELLITLDTTAPALAANNELIFPFSVRPPESITAAYLANNGDRVEAELPIYRPAAPGDVVVAYWKNPANNTSHEFRSAPLTSNNYEDPVVLAFTGDFLRDTVGDGKREVTYQVEDRAGNSSLESVPQELEVAVIRPPRFAPRPWVAEIEAGTPSEWGELNAENARNGATVLIPSEAVYYDDDRVEVQFGDPGTTNSITVPVPSGAREVLIPKEYIAAYFNKELPVYYTIYLPDDSTRESGHLTLAIKSLSNFILAPQLVSPYSDPVYKSQIPSTGLPLFQRKWSFISTRCLITMTVSGRGTDGASKNLAILEEHPISNSQVNDGVNATAARDFMLALEDNTRFIVKTKVSFDGGQTWFNSTELRPELRP